MPSRSTRWRRFSNSAFALRGPISSTRRSYSGPPKFRSAAPRLIRMLTTAAATATMTRMTTIKIMVPADIVTSVTSACGHRLPLGAARKPAEAGAMPARQAFPRTITRGKRGGMSGMAMVPEVPEVPGSHGLRRTRSTARSAAAWVAAVLVGNVAVGLLGGLIWGEAAPRAALQEIGAGTAEVVNAETRAFFGADVWFCAIAVLAGLLTGVLGYRFAVARRDGAARAAVAGAM